MVKKNLKELRKNRKSLKELREKAQSVGGSKDYSDDRFWLPTRDKSGKGKATIRFLPGDPEWVIYYNHTFKKNNKWFIEKCPTSIEQDCPVCDANSELYDSGRDKEAQPRTRNMKFVTNILVIDDPAKPENNDKVFLFEFGKMLFGKIQEKLAPEYEDEDAVDVFDFYEGCDFVLKVSGKSLSTSYDKSVFNESSALVDDDDEADEILEKTYDLEEFIDPKKYMDYDSMQKKLEKVVSNKGSSGRKSVEDDEGENDYDEDEEEEETNSKKTSFKDRKRRRAGARDDDNDDDSSEDDEGDNDYDEDEEEKPKTTRRRRRPSKKKDDDDEDDDDEDAKEFQKRLKEGDDELDDEIPFS